MNHKWLHQPDVAVAGYSVYKLKRKTCIVCGDSISVTPYTTAYGQQSVMPVFTDAKGEDILSRRKCLPIGKKQF